MITDTDVSILTRAPARAIGVIGRIHTPFSGQADLPAPDRDNAHRGTVLVLGRYAAGLTDVHGFDRIWLIHQAPRTGAAALLVTPAGDQSAHGVFATRAGSRPNRLGMTCVRLLHVAGKRLFVEGVDMLDGSDLLDIRPYIPDFDAFPTSWAGWRERATARREQWPLRKAARE